MENVNEKLPSELENLRIITEAEKFHQKMVEAKAIADENDRQKRSVSTIQVTAVNSDIRITSISTDLLPVLTVKQIASALSKLLGSHCLRL